MTTPAGNGSCDPHGRGHDAHPTRWGTAPSLAAPHPDRRTTLRASATAPMSPEPAPTHTPTPPAKDHAPTGRTA